MSYKINTTDPFNGTTISVADFTSNGPIHPTSAILESTAISAGSSLLFYGRGHPSYGERMAENMLNLLENFSGASEPQYPVSGQLWNCRYDYINANGNWWAWNHTTLVWDSITVNIGIPTVLVGFDGDFWLDGTTLLRIVDKPSNPLTPSTITLKYTETVDFSDPNAVAYFPLVELLVRSNNDWIGTSNVTVSLIEPTVPKIGKLWFDTVAGVLKVYDGAVFNSIIGGFVQLTGDTMSGDLDMDSNFLLNIPTPTLAGHAANKDYVDTQVATVDPSTTSINIHTDVDTITSPPSASDAFLKWSVGDSEWQPAPVNFADILDLFATGVSLANMTNLTGLTTNVQNKFNSLDLDVAGKLALTGGTLTGNLTISPGNFAKAIAAPVLVEDLTNKGYVDAEIATTASEAETLYAQFSGSNFTVLNGSPIGVLIDATANTLDPLSLYDTISGQLDLSNSALIGFNGVVVNTVINVTINVVWDVATSDTGIRRIRCSAATSFEDTKLPIVGQVTKQSIVTGPISLGGNDLVGVEVFHDEPTDQDILFYSVGIEVIKRFI